MAEELKKLYRKDELNKIIDSILHPLADRFRDSQPWIAIGIEAIDTFLHAVVEQNPQESIEKFIRYNLPFIIDNVVKALGGQGKQAAKEDRERR